MVENSPKLRFRPQPVEPAYSRVICLLRGFFGSSKKLRSRNRPDGECSRDYAVTTRDYAVATASDTGMPFNTALPESGSMASWSVSTLEFTPANS